MDIEAIIDELEYEYDNVESVGTMVFFDDHKGTTCELALFKSNYTMAELEDMIEHALYDAKMRRSAGLA